MDAGPCPDQETLFGYMMGTIPEGEAEIVGRHLAACSECERTADALEGLSDTMIVALRRPDGGDAYADVPECGQVLDKLRNLRLGDGGPGNRPATVAPTKKPRRVTRLGDYELLTKLGQGGMGTVYKARHTRLKRVVALKVLPKNRLEDEVAVARFEREMEAVGRLDHPNIVRAMDAREVDRIRFLVMEYVDGLDLSEVVDRCGPLSLAEASEVIRQAALGLECSRENGLVHRDIKPSNLMLTTEGQVKVLDLGLAQIQEIEPLGAEVTGLGHVMGTPDYISPEQALESHTVDVRTDVYSLGCTLYCLLVGHPPFTGPDYDTPMKKVTGHIRDAVPPIQALKPDLPKPIVRLLERMLAKDPNERIASPSEVACAMAPFCQGSKLIGLLRRAQSRDEEEEAGGSRVETGDFRASAMIDTSRDDLTPDGDKPESSASTALDPYHRWLGIPPEDQPANHYRLLGLALFEGDAEVIRDAAARQMAHVRTYHLGPHAEMSQEILNELGAAKACLLNSQKKAAYDAWLRTAQRAESSDDCRPPEPPPISVEFLAPAQAATSPSGIERPPMSMRPLGLRRFEGKKAPISVLVAAGVAALFVLYGIVVNLTTGTVQIRITPNDPGEEIEVTLDGDAIEPADLDAPVRLRLHDHKLVVTASNYERHEQTLGIERGYNGQVTVTLTPRAPVAPAVEAPVVATPPVAAAETVKADLFALLFDGQKAHVDIADFDYTGDYPVTIEAFVTPFRLVSQQEQCVFSCRGGGSSGICLCLDQSGHWVFRLLNSSPQSTEPATLYRRVHVAGVFDRQWCWLFVDGKQQGGRVKTGFSRTHRYSYVGADPNHYRKTVNLFQGLIEQVRISKVARYQGNFAPEKVLLADTDTVLLYRFDQGSGRQAIDLSGNDHHGLIKGAAWARPDDYPPPNAEADRPEMSQRPAGSEPLASTNPTEPPPLAIAPFDADRANQHQQAWAEYLDVPSPMTNSIGMELLLIPPGEFMMGSPEDDPKKADGETPQHRVRITKPFYLGVDEVTQEQYEKVMGENPSSFKEPSRPVESISWDDAAAFCAKLSAMDSRLQYRLPTEAEWEYACRAGTATRYSCGDDMDPRYAWFGDNSGRETHPVGRTLPNAWGLCDMHGNVWEYCHDWYDEDYYASSPLDDPAGPATGSDRVHRGGCWDFSTRQCWSACRRGHGPNFRGGGMGFRVARDLPIEAIAAPRAETDGLAGNTATASMQPQSPALAGTLSKPAAEGARIQAATEAQSPGDRLQEIILPTGTSWNPDAFEIDRSKLDILLDDYESDRPWVFGSVEQHRWFKYAVYRYRENDEGNFELDGLAAAFQENDEVVYYAEYRQNDLNGLMMTWSPEGKPVYCGQYRGNRRQGLCCLFENDSPRLISEYDNDNLVACVWIDGSERKGYKKEQLAEAEPVRELLARMDDIQADAIREYKKTLISQLVDDRRQKELEKTRAIGASVRKRNHAEIVQRTNARHVESLLRMQQKQREAH